MRMFERITIRLLSQVPASWRRGIIGTPAHPSGVATFVHNFLNRIAPPQSQVYDCHGPLAGYRMVIDWNRFRAFVYGTWEPEVVQAITAVVKPGMCIADIGAHIGYFTLLFAKCVGPSGQVVSFEPFPANFALLQKNIQINRLPNVQAFPVAVFSHSHELAISSPEGLPNPEDATTCPEDPSSQVRVPATTLDAFCLSSGLRLDFLKIDVEGAEYEVLTGAKETIARYHPKILIELHHFDGDLSANRVPGLLVDWDYEIVWLDRWNMTSHILATSKSYAGGDSPATPAGFL
jgi:FkbM family methyltransferase